MKAKKKAKHRFPPKISPKAYSKFCEKLTPLFNIANQLLSKLPSKKLLFILQLCDALNSIHLHSETLDFIKACQLIHKNQKNLPIIHIKNHLAAIQLLNQITPQTSFDIPFMERLNGLLEKDYGKIAGKSGLVRISQNWLGKHQSKIEEAVILPPHLISCLIY